MLHWFVRTLFYDAYTCAAVTFFVCDCICVCQGMFTHILIEAGQACTIRLNPPCLFLCVCIYMSVYVCPCSHQCRTSVRNMAKPFFVMVRGN